ncbi:MAG: hypothetical protein ACJ71M_15635, partial [Nitrososphaeraceae archaeon]
MVYAEYTMDTEMVEEKIGEVLGLEMAAQKAVEQLVSKGLLDKGSVNTTSRLIKSPLDFDN